MSIERNLQNAAIRERYDLEGMVPCGKCGRALWPTAEFFEGNFTEGELVGKPELPLCPECAEAKSAKKAKS